MRFVLTENQDTFAAVKPTARKQTDNNKVNRRRTGREFNSSVAADGDETERQTWLT